MDRRPVIPVVLSGRPCSLEERVDEPDDLLQLTS